MKKPLENRKDLIAKLKKDPIFILTAICLLVFLIGLILALVLKDSSVGNDLLFASGIIEIIATIILYKVTERRVRMTCPSCGTKREHHRQYLGTSDKITSGNDMKHGVYKKTEYTHKYHDSYVCPNCGETMEENITRGGGRFISYADGYVLDNRSEPKEF